jgi:hypothetical protein
MCLRVQWKAVLLVRAPLIYGCHVGWLWRRRCHDSIRGDWNHQSIINNKSSEITYPEWINRFGTGSALDWALLNYPRSSRWPSTPSRLLLLNSSAESLLNCLRQLDPNSRCIGPRIKIKLWLFPPELSRDEQHRQDVSWSRTAAVKQSTPEGDIQKWTNGFWRWIDTRYKPSLRSASAAMCKCWMNAGI